MLLTPTEYERLTIYVAAELARKHRNKGLKLNHPEAMALIADEILEGAREGRSVADLMSKGAVILTTDDVMPGVAQMIPMLQVECTFPDGTKLVTVHEPIRPGSDVGEGRQPGEIIFGGGDVTLNAGRTRTEIEVLNTGDRPVQVGSHYHFFEANKALDFDRGAAFGLHLDVPSGTAVRFEPGQSRTVTLVPFGGQARLSGLNNLTDGAATDRESALAKARAKGFKGA